MDVTRLNFKSLLPQIIGDMNKSHFISFDQELSGIFKEEWRKQRKYETMEELYLKNRRFTQGFSIMQFRMTCFYGGDRQEDEIKYRSYSFFVNSSQRKCLVDGQAMAYLAENDFDFVKLFQHGISYGDAEDEKKLYHELEQRQKKRVPNGIRQRHKELEVPEKIRPYLVRVSAQIDAFLADEEAFDLTVGPFNSHTKLFVYQIIEGKYEGRMDTLREEVGVGRIRLRKSSVGNKQLQDKCAAEELQIIEDELGMRRLVQALTNSKKLLVGHNIFVHLMYIVRQFFQQLPVDYKEYKKIVNGLFPHVIDTKHMSTEEQTLKILFGMSVITKMIHTVHLAPFSLPTFVADGAEFGHSIDLARLDIASGSLRIGICFLGMVRLLGVRISGGHEPLQRNAIIRPFLNKLFAKCSTLCKTAVLDGDEKFQERDVVFYATFPKTWDRWWFQELLKDFGNCKVIFFDETTGVLAFNFKLSGRLHEVGDPMQVHPDLKLKPYNEYVREKWADLH